MRATAAVRAIVPVAVLAVVLPATSASASRATTKGGSFSLSGQESGTLALDVAKTCVPDNFSAAPLSEDIRLYLTDHGLKPTNALWFMTIEAKSPRTVSYPAKAPNTVALGADSGIKPDILWSTGSGEPRVGSGSVTLKPGFEARSFNLVLAPSTGAKGSEKIVGHWSCK